MRFDNTLQAFRLDRNMTQAELARRVDVSRQTIASIEKGDTEPRLSVAVNIAQVLRGEDIYDVFFHSSEMKGKRVRNYTKIDELSQAISRGLSLQNKRMVYEESMAAAEHLINFFGYSDRVIDNMLEPEDRDAFYTMEDIGVLRTEREETTLFDGREWRIHYWILNISKIMSLAQMKSNYMDMGEDQDFSVYEEIPDEYWSLN